MTLMEGSSFGDNLMAVLPDVIGQTIGSMAASRMQQANRPRVDAKDQASAGGYYVDADSMPIEESPTGIRYFVQPGELVGGGQPTARRGFWGRQYDRFLKPIVDPVVSALGRAFRGGIDYTREATGAAYVALSNEITELEEVIVTGVRQTQNNVRQTWTDFSQAWSIQPQRRPLGETFFSPAPPSNPITWLNSDIGVRQAIARDEHADADGLNAMRSVTNPWATNAGLSVRSGLEWLHAGFANVFAVPFGVIDAGPGRLAEAGGLRWKSSENVTGHMMAEPTIMVGSVFIGNPQAMAGGMAPKAISIGRAEVLAAESVVPNGPRLLATEGNVGTYRDLIRAGTPGDNITPNHIPSANHMTRKGVSRGDGIAINMEHPVPGVGGRHRATFTYGTQADINMSARDALAAGVWDARQIYQSEGLYTSEIRSSLQEVIRMNKVRHPEIFRRPER